MKKWFAFNWLKIVAIVLLVGAVPAFSFLPFAYYQFMNWVVVGASVVLALQAYKQNNPYFMWMFLLVAAVFNPLAPFYFRADVWHIADIVAAVLFTISLFFIQPSKK